jgi:hypothetical protein
MQEKSLSDLDSVRVWDNKKLTSLTLTVKPGCEEGADSDYNDYWDGNGKYTSSAYL